MKDELTITIEGPDLNKFLRCCTEENINIKNVIFIREGKIKVSCGKRDLKKIEKITKNNYIVEIINERGPNFFLSNLRNRKTTIIGIIVFSALLFYQSLFISRIDIIGLEKINEEDIKIVLAENGIFEGCKRGEYDLEATEYDMLEKIQGIAWMELHEKGGMITVDIVESLDTPEEIDEGEPTNIIAMKDGVIEEIISKEGQNVVAPGDYVHAGDLLVTGAIPRKKEEGIIRYVKCDSQVYARCIYIFKIEEEKTEIEDISTGKFSPGIYFRFGDVIFDSGKLISSSNIIKGFDDYYEKEQNLIDLSIPLPVKLSIVGINETEKGTRERSMSEIKRAGELNLLKEMKKNMGDRARIVKKDLQFSEEENIIEVTGIFEVIEEIGGEEPIVYDRLED